MLKRESLKRQSVTKFKLSCKEKQNYKRKEENAILESYDFTEYLQENKDFVRGSHATQADGNYKYAPSVPGLYIIKHMDTGKFYVGQTSEVGRRLSHHFGHLRNNVHICYRLQELYNISSECSFMFKYVLIDSAEDRYNLEEEILKEYKNSELLLNTTIDGETWIHDRNLDRVNAYKEKMSNVGKDRIGDKNSFYGKRHTDECKKRMSDIKTGSTNPNCWKAVVVNGKYYKKLEDASVDIGIPLETVAHRVNNNDYVYCNYYAPEDENDIKIIDDRLLFNPKMKTVRCVYEIEGNIYYKTDDILEDYPEIKRSSIHHRIKSKNPKFKNWKKII